MNADGGAYAEAGTNASNPYGGGAAPPMALDAGTAKAARVGPGCLAARMPGAGRLVLPCYLVNGPEDVLGPGLGGAQTATARHNPEGRLEGPEVNGRRGACREAGKCLRPSASRTVGKSG